MTQTRGVISPVIRSVTQSVINAITGGGGGGGGGGTVAPFTVLSKLGFEFLSGLDVLDKDGNSFTVTADVLDVDGNSFTCI